jgi:hypothetical protein
MGLSILPHLTTYEYDSTGYPVTTLLVDRQHPLHPTGVTWLAQPVFTPTNSGYTQLRPRPDNPNAPTGGPMSYSVSAAGFA